MLAALEQGSAEASTDLKALGGGEGHHRLDLVQSEPKEKKAKTEKKESTKKSKKVD